MKICPKCKQNKEISEFYKDRTKKDGCCTWCIACKNKNVYDNKEYYKNWHKEHYQKNRTKILIRINKYKKDNKEIIAAKHKIYYNKNRDAFRKKGKEKYELNKLEIREKRKLHRQANKEYYARRSKKSRQTVNGKFAAYKEGAAKRNLPFEINIDVFKTYWQMPCGYCKHNINTIGIDRVDNNCGYTKSNMISCCFDCNTTKSNLSYAEWKDYIFQVRAFVANKETRTIERIAKRHRTPRIQFWDYKNGAKIRKMTFDLSFDEFYSFKDRPCTYCGTITSNRIGIDRINSDAGYSINNCASCCKICNGGKSKKTLSEWNSYLKRLISNFEGAIK